MYQTPTRKVSDIFIAVKRQFGDESGVQLEDSDLLRWLNDAQNEINSENKVLKSTSTTPAVIGQGAYTFPSAQILQVESLHFNGVPVKNIPFAQAEDALIGVDPTAMGIPQFWYEWGGTFTFWPAPDTTDNITLYYTKIPDDILPDYDAVTAVIGLPDKYDGDIIAYMLKQAYEMDEDWQASGAKKQEFTEGLAAKRDDERRAQDMTFNVITLVDD